MKRKIKVLHFTIAQSQGGRTQYVMNNWRHIDKERFQIDFVTFSPQLDLEEEIVSQGGNVFHMTCYARDNREQFVKELDAVLDRNYDVLHLHTSYWEDTVVEERAKAKGIRKVIIHAHNTGVTKALSESETEKGIKRHYEVREKIDDSIATDYWACSTEAARWLYGDRIPQEKIRIMKNGIETNKYQYDAGIRRTIREKYLIPDDCVVLGTVGRMVYQKNQEFLIDLLEKIDKKYNVIIMLVGDGERKKEYEENIKKKNLQKKVIFTGQVKNVSDYLQGMDIFCLPSRKEAFGIALLEAQCSDLTCLVSDAVSDYACISNKVKKIPLDPECWKKEIEEIIQCKEYLNRKETNEIKNSGFDIKELAEELEKLYCEGIQDE